MSERPTAGRAAGNPLAAVAVVAAFLVIVVVVVARLPASGTGPGGGTGTGTTVPLTGRAAIGIDLELPAAGTTSSTTTTTSTAASTTTTTTAHGSTTTTTTVKPGLRPVPPAGVEAALHRAGFTILTVGATASPPLTTQIQYLPGHLHDARTVRVIIRVPGSSISPYPGPTAGLPSGTDVVVLVGTQG